MTNTRSSQALTESCERAQIAVVKLDSLWTEVQETTELVVLSKQWFCHTRTSDNICRYLGLSRMTDQVGSATGIERVEARGTAQHPAMPTAASNKGLFISEYQQGGGREAQSQSEGALEHGGMWERGLFMSLDFSVSTCDVMKS